MYMLAKSFYMQVSWGQRTIYKGLSSFIAEETKQKITLTGEATHTDLTTLFHPTQLERRFGGAMDTPTVFWPPYVGTEFNPTPNDEDRRRMFMTDNEYKQALQ
jgi:hypothetical protein